MEEIVQVRMTTELKDKLTQEAKKLNISLAAYIRMKLS